MARGPRLAGDAPREMHLVVLQHGMWGCPTDVEYVAEALRQAGDGRSMLVLNSDVNVARLTYDGIDVLGDRLASLVISYCSRLASGGLRKVTKISFVAYSLGGLIARYAIGKLASLGFFCTASPLPGAGYDSKQHKINPRQQGVIPVNYVSFATPHLGSWAPPTTLYRKAFNAVLPYTLSRTGSQLVLADNFKDGKPLLAVMADPQYAFLPGLSMFQKRIALANTRHDATVPFTTASISPYDPYEHEQGAPIHPMYPCIVRPVSAPQLTAQPAFLATSQQLLLAPSAATPQTKSGCGVTQQSKGSSDMSLLHPDAAAAADSPLPQAEAQAGTSSNQGNNIHTSSARAASNTTSPKDCSCHRSPFPFSFTAGEASHLTTSRNAVHIPTARSISAIQPFAAGACNSTSTAGSVMASTSKGTQASPNKPDAVAHVWMPGSQLSNSKQSEPLDVALSVPTIRTNTHSTNLQAVSNNSIAATSTSGEVKTTCSNMEQASVTASSLLNESLVGPSQPLTPPSRKAVYQMLRQDRCEPFVTGQEVDTPGSKRRVNRQAAAAGSEELCNASLSALLSPKRVRDAHRCVPSAQTAGVISMSCDVFRPAVDNSTDEISRVESSVLDHKTSWRASSVISVLLEQFGNREWLRERLRMWHSLCRKQQQGTTSNGMQLAADKHPVRKQSSSRSPTKPQHQAVPPVAGRRAVMFSNGNLRLTPTRQRRLQTRSDNISPRAIPLRQVQPFYPYLTMPQGMHSMEIQPWGPRPSMRKQAPYFLQSSSAYHPAMAAMQHQRDRSKALALPGPTKPRVRATQSMALLQQLSSTSSTVGKYPRATEKLAKDSRLRGEVFVVLLPVLVVLWCCMLLWLLALSTRHYMLLVRVKKDRSWNMQWPPKRAQQAPAVTDNTAQSNLKIEDITDLPDAESTHGLHDNNVGSAHPGGVMQRLASFAANPSSMMRAWAQIACTWAWQAMMSLMWGSAASWWDVLQEQWEESFVTFQSMQGSSHGTIASCVGTLFHVVCWLASCACYLPGFSALAGQAMPQRGKKLQPPDNHTSACMVDHNHVQSDGSECPAERSDDEQCSEENEEPIQTVQQRKMCNQLNQLRWHKVDVDTRHFHAHAAIVVRSAARFSTTHGHVVQYAIRQMRDLS